MPEEAAPAALEEPQPPAPAQEPDWKAEHDKLQREARKWEDRAKSNSTAAKELEDLRKQSMTEQEKAVEQAKAEARKEAFGLVGSRLVDAEVKAAVAGRNVNVDALLEGLDRSRFLTDDGEPDTKAITKWVDALVPADPAKPGFPDLGQGARGSASADTAGDAMNALLRSRR
jgi:hypothetical protein